MAMSATGDVGSAARPRRRPDADDADTVAPFDRRAEWARALDQVIDDLAAELRVGEQRAAALRGRFAEPERNRVQLDVDQLGAAPARHRDDGLPDLAIGGEPTR